MKKINQTLWIVGLVIFALLSSCSKDEDTVSSSRPDTYIIGINLGVETPLTKGVVGGTFNSTYEEDVIYLHKKTDDASKSESIEIPVYSYDCQDPNNPGQCNGFRFEVQKNDDGSYTLTPLTEEGTKGSGMTVHADDNFYFSSIENRQWKVNYDTSIDHIQEDFEAPAEVTTSTNELYTRDPEANKEIYRSTSDYTLDQILDLRGDLEMERTCSGYSFMALFTTRTADEDGYYDLTSDLFEETMGSDYKDWYIKIYLGNVFTNTYDMQEKDGKQAAGGFYGSTDKDKYAGQGIDDGFYLPFKNRITPGSTIDEDNNYTGIGYQSASNNLLISPTDADKSEDFTAFIFIKHWTGTGEPTDEWLQSNDDAIYTQVTLQDVVSVGIKDGIFYQCGILIDINELKAAAEQAGILTAPTTKSMATHDNKPKKFTLHNAETFVNY